MPHNEQPVEDYHEGDALELITTVEMEDGTIMDLTGASATWNLREDIKNHENLLTKQGSEGGTGDEIDFIDPADGMLKVIIATDDTEGFIDWENELGTERELYHELYVTDTEGRRVKGFHGPFHIHL